MAEKNYYENNQYGSGIFVPGNLDIGGIGIPADSRLMVENLEKLDWLVTNRRVYDGMIVYCKATGTYHKCSVQWNSDMSIASSEWTQVEIQSLDELKALIAQESTAAMEFKGTIKDGNLPTLEEGKNYDGHLYKVATKNVTIPAALNAEEEVEVVAKPGDSIVCENGKWYLIPSGDDIEDTWRAIKVNGVEKLGNGTTTNAVDFQQGDNVTITEAGGVITIAAEDTHYESKLVAANSATDAADETAEDGQVHLNLIENDEVKSSHRIVGKGGITVTHALAEGEDGVNTITIEAPEGAKYDLAAKTENGEAVLSLAGTDNSEDTVAIVGHDAVTVTVDGGKIKVSAHDTTYTGSEGDEIKVDIADGAITAELAEAVSTKLGYIDTDKSITTAITDQIAELSNEGGAIHNIVKDGGTIDDKIAALNLDTTYVKEEGFNNKVADIKVKNATHADTAGTADSATNAGHAGTADSATHATAAGKVDTAITVKIGGADIIFDGSEAKTADVDTAIKNAIDAIPDVTHPDYSIVKDTTSDYAATYHLTKNGENIGAAINIPKDMVVEHGEVVELAEGEVEGYPAGTYIKLTLANATNDTLYIAVGELIEYVTSGSAEGDMVYVTVDPATHKVTATITDGTITEAKLHKDVTDKLNKTWATTEQGGKADTALQNIEVGTGLTVTNKVTGEGEEAVTDPTTKVINIDEEVIFVLDCNY